MLKIVGNDIYRSGEKVGWASGNDIYGKDGGKLGYFLSNDIYNYDGLKLGYVGGDYIKTSDGRGLRLDDNRTHHVTGGSASDLERAAIRLLLGD